MAAAAKRNRSFLRIDALTKIDDQEPEDICGTGNKVARQTNWDYPPHRKKNS
jgi:hypothetical protein